MPSASRPEVNQIQPRAAMRHWGAACLKGQVKQLIVGTQPWPPQASPSAAFVSGPADARKAGATRRAAPFGAALRSPPGPQRNVIIAGWPPGALLRPLASTGPVRGQGPTPPAPAWVRASLQAARPGLSPQAESGSRPCRRRAAGRLAEWRWHSPRRHPRCGKPAGVRGPSASSRSRRRLCRGPGPKRAGWRSQGLAKLRGRRRSSQARPARRLSSRSRSRSPGRRESVGPCRRHAAEWRTKPQRLVPQGRSGRP